MRLDKFVSHATDLSRSQVRKALRAGLICVNNAIAQTPATHVTDKDIVTLHNVQILPASVRYFMLHKPAGYVCATKDGVHPTVIDLLNEPNKENLQISGRLDMDTTGLVLITDNGQWNHRITSPRSSLGKRYYVEVDAPIAMDTAAKFAHGVQLHGEKKPTLPAQLNIEHGGKIGNGLNNYSKVNSAYLTIYEGKYHQIKRMFAALGYHVVALHRESIGDIALDNDLQPGDYRPLTTQEIQSFY